MSWRQCPPEDDSGPGLPLADAQTLPQRSKRAWCTLALDESDGPSRKQRRAAPPVRISGERSENQRSDEQVRERTFQCAFARKWCQLDISDDELPLQKQRRLAQDPRPGHPRQLNRDWRQLDLQGIGGDDHAVRRKDWRQPDLHEHAVPEPSAVRTKEASLSATTLSFLSNLPTKQVLNEYDKNGMDPSRIRHVLQGCCKCPRDCASQFTFNDLQSLCRVYHQMLEHDRQYMLHTMYTSEAASQVQGPEVSDPQVSGPRSGHRHDWYILGHKVCVPAFANLLGISTKKLYKNIRLAIDARRSLDDAGPIHPRSAPQLDLCHHFFRALYTSAAEVLPMAPLRMGGDSEDSSDEQDELDGWSPDRPMVEIVGDSIGDLDPAQLPVRRLPLFSMSDLYWQFQAWYEGLVHTGGEPEGAGDPEDDAQEDALAPPAEAKKPSRKTFSRAWHHSWSKVLRLTFPSQHSCCQTCFELREKTYRTWAPLEQKMHFARQWRDHLRDQYMDRMLYWNLRFLSRSFDSTVLVIIIDSMDRKKAVWPKYDFTRKPHQIEALKPRPRMTVTGGIAHGWCTGIFITQETLSHGSNAYVEVLCQLLDKVAELCRVQGRRFPVHLVLQADNTVAQTKNQYAAAFCSQMVGMRKFSTVTLNFLMVGHTHEDIDQLFALICQYVIRRHRWQTPEEFQRLVQESLAQKVAAKGEVLVVRGLRCIREYAAWLEPQRITLYGCWGNRDGFEAPHSFAFKRRSDLSAHELAQVQGRRVRGFPEHPEDVLCCVKAYMRDKSLQQEPLVVLPQSRRDRVQGRPNTVEPIRMTDDRASQLESIATVIEQDCYRYHRAARALRELARSRVAPPLPAPGWLEEPPVAPPPVVDMGNEYFGHLPDISWHMHARVHRI